VCVWIEKRAIDPSQKKEKRKLNIDNYFPSRNKEEVFWINQQKKMRHITNNTFHTHTHT